MRTPFVVAALVASTAVVSCVTQSTPQNLEAGPDQFAPPCTTSKDCASGLSCTYEVLVGCGAKGECRDFGPDAGDGLCLPATTACGCDGKLVQIPACWMGFAPVPVVSSGQTTCADASTPHPG